MPETEQVEISAEQQKTLEPWIEQFDKSFGLTDAQKISILLGMALGYCEKNKVDFNALLGAAIAAEAVKQEDKADDQKPEGD